MAALANDNCQAFFQRPSQVERKEERARQYVATLAEQCPAEQSPYITLDVAHIPVVTPPSLRQPQPQPGEAAEGWSFPSPLKHANSKSLPAESISQSKSRTGKPSMPNLVAPHPVPNGPQQGHDGPTRTGS